MSLTNENRMSAISIVMTAYNAEETIAEAIESILNQSFTDFEFIIVNDGSTDSTRSIIGSYDDKRIRLIDNEHDYIQSLNTGLKASTGKYIARMDADDISHIDRFKLQYSIMEESPEITVCCSWMFMFGEKAPSKIFEQNISGIIESPLVQLFLDDFIINPTAMIRNSFVKEHNLLYENYMCAEDYKYWVDVAMFNGVFYVDSQPLVYKRVADSQITIKYRDIQIETTSKIKKEIIHALCHENKECPALMSLCNAYYELLDQKLISESGIVLTLYSLFMQNKDKLNLSKVKPVI